MLDLGDFFNSITGKIAGKNSILVSPIWTAVIIALLLMLILFLVIYEEIELKYEDSSMINLAGRVAIWGFVGGLILAFLRDSALNASYLDKYKNHGQHKLVNRVVDNVNLEGIEEPRNTTENIQANTENNNTSNI